MTSKIDKIFLELVKAGIWGQRTEVSVEAKEWAVLMQMSERQSLLAVVFDGIQTLPMHLLPPMDILMDWLGQVEHIVTQNDTINKDVARLVRFMDHNCVASRLMKGQGCASYYPHPEHRQCGDIDLFVGNEYYQQAKESLAKMGVKIKRETAKDAQFTFGDSPVEMHRMEDHFYSTRLDSVFQQICRMEEWVNPRVVKIGGEDVALFNVTFNVFYIFVHLYHHFLQVGVGLRQVCDWMMVMHKDESDVDWQKLEGWLRGIKALRAWNTFYGLTVEYLGQHLQNSPEWMNRWSKDDVEFILDDIICQGNFGKYGESLRKREFRGGLFRNIGSFLALTKRLWRIQGFGRREVWAYPMWRMTKDKGMWKRYK